MEAPIDIIISIIRRHIVETEGQKVEDIRSADYRQGKITAYEGLIEEFEGFKKLFA